MSIRKDRRADLRRSYPFYLEIGYIVALGVLIVAFRADLSPESDFEVVLQDREQIHVDEIPQTDLFEKPPPPPKPRVPIVKPNEMVLEDDELTFESGIEEGNVISATPPPPRKKPKPDPEPEPFYLVEEKPEPIGGMKAIYEQVKEYPDMARRAGVEGRVTVQFVVDEEGYVRDAVVLRGVGAGLDELALEAILNTRFKPGMQRGTAVPVKMSLPIVFKLR